MTGQQLQRDLPQLAQIAAKIPTTRPPDKSKHSVASTGLKEAPMRVRRVVTTLVSGSVAATAVLTAELWLFHTSYSFFLCAAMFILLVRPLERYLSAPKYRSVSIALRKSLILISWTAAVPWFFALVVFCIIWGLALQVPDTPELKLAAALSAALPLGAMMLALTIVPEATTLLTWKPLRSTHALYGTIHLLRYLTVAVLGAFIAIAALPWSTGQTPQFAIVSAIVLAATGFVVSFQKHSAEQIQSLNAALSKVFIASANMETTAEGTYDHRSLLEAVVELCDLFAPKSFGILTIPTQRLAADGPVQMVWERAAEELSGTQFGRIAPHASDVLDPAFEAFGIEELSQALAEYAIHLKHHLPPQSQRSIAQTRESLFPSKAKTHMDLPRW